MTQGNPSADGVAPPGWYYGWNILAVGMLFQAGTFGLSLYAFTFWVEPWIGAFDASRGQLMLGMTFAQILAGALGPLVGRVIDTASIRAVVALGVIAFGIGHALVGFAAAAWQVVALYAVFAALGIVLAGPMAAQTLAARWFRARPGMAMGWVTTGTSLGGFLLPPLAAFLLVSVGWRWAHIILGVGMIVVILPIVWLVVRNSPEAAGMQPEFEPAAGELGCPEWTVPRILRERSFWALIATLLPSLTAVNALQINLAPLAQDMGVGAQRTSLLMSVLAGTMIGGKLFFGMMADRWDHRLLFALSLAALGNALVLLTNEPPFSLLVLASMLLGFAAGGFLPLIGAFIGERFGAASFGRVMGLAMPFMTLSAVGAPIAGGLRDAFGAYDPALQAFLGALAVALLVILFGMPGPVDAKASR